MEVAISRSKFPPAVYGALKNAGMSNREIARHLGVNESSVRRGLRDHIPRQREQKFLVTVSEVD
jgi:IS30 family transposase